MVHVKDEDIAALDKFVVAQELSIRRRRERPNEDPEGTLVRLLADGGDPAVTVIFMPWSNMQNGHIGLLMLALVVVAIMLGFPTAFTLMGMGVFFAWLAYRSGNPDIAVRRRWT
jgi:hypothetical protein